MWEAARALVLSHVPYGDKGVILRCLTDAHGQQAYYIPSIRSKQAAVRPSMLLPFTPLQIVARHMEKERLERIREAQVLHHFKWLHRDPVKSASALYLAELTQQLFTDGQAQQSLWSFLFDALCGYDASHEDVHFPLWMTIRLLTHAGFSPSPSPAPSYQFALQQGEWYLGDLPESLSLGASVLLDRLLRSTAEEASAIQSATLHRRELMDGMLIYFRYHVPGMRSLKSIEIVRELLA